MLLQERGMGSGWKAARQQVFTTPLLKAVMEGIQNTLQNTIEK